MFFFKEVQNPNSLKIILEQERTLSIKLTKLSLQIIITGDLYFLITAIKTSKISKISSNSEEYRPTFLLIAAVLEELKVLAEPMQRNTGMISVFRRVQFHSPQQPIRMSFHQHFHCQRNCFFVHCSLKSPNTYIYEKFRKCIICDTYYMLYNVYIYIYIYTYNIPFKGIFNM